MRERLAHALDDLGAVVAGIDRGAIAEACVRIAGAGAIVLYGCGREGLQLRGLAMRLHHLGLRASVQGDMAAPPVGPGDLFIASAGPGELATVTALMQIARDAGADVLFLTAQPACPASHLATQVLHVPAQTMADDAGPSVSVLPMGSVYEGALFLLFEILVLDLRDRLGVGADAMRARHTNLE